MQLILLKSGVVVISMTLLTRHKSVKNTLITGSYVYEFATHLNGKFRLNLVYVIDKDDVYEAKMSSSVCYLGLVRRSAVYVKLHCTM